jgi:hypothetical protein
VKGFSGVGAGEVVVEVTVGGEELFGAGIVRLEVRIGEGPGGGDATPVVEDAEVFGAEAKEGRAVDLGLAADEVGLLWVKGLIVLVEPDVFRVVSVVEEDRAGVSVEFFLWEKGAALEDEDSLPCPREIKGEGSAAGSGSDDDGVVLVGHDECSSI